MGSTVSGCLRGLGSCSTSEANRRTAASLTWSLHPTMLHRAETARIPAAIVKRQVYDVLSCQVQGSSNFTSIV